ncbi:MAG: TIGR01458 family HAD-type hydrolase, partial [Gammaproteobacteria bacterium]
GVELLGLAPDEVWMVGDDIRGDVGGAQAAGLHGILVRTGKFRPADLEQGIEPDLVIDSIASLPDVWTGLNC